MSAFRNHRVVIASLFLPNTAVLGGESSPPTPELTAKSFATGLPPKPRFGESPIVTRPGSPRSVAHVVNAPKRSIVDDLKDKSSRIASRAVTPSSDEKANPFAKLPTHATLDGAAQAIAKEVKASPLRKHQTTHSVDSGPARMARKGSTRSGSRKDSPRVPYHTPWRVETNSHCNGGLKNAIESVGGKLKRRLWVGTLGTATDGMGEPLREDIDSRMLVDCSSVPVWIPDAEFSSAYDEFCHSVLWPCLHYAIPDAPKTKVFYESASYKQYVAVNQRFADAIIANYQDGDIIWVNDYHLMLLPAMLRASPHIPAHAPIGFFLHVAFPSSEIFRCLSVREPLLRGLLAADLVGFQTANFARHFRQTVSRILACEALPKGIQIEADGDGNERFVDVGVFPMGIDVSALQEKKRDPDVTEWVQVLKQRYSGMKLLVGRDKLDEVQGVRHKIQAFETFLEKNPEFQGKVVLIQIALHTTEANELAGGVADVVSHINSRFSSLTYQPVVFLHTQDLTFSQYLALLTVADAFVVTSLREGMALRTHEFVECQQENHRPLILSEFTGSYSYSGFRSCIAVNPWDKRGTALAIHQALTMSDDEALHRWEDLHNHVVTQTAQAFVSSFLTRCLRSNTQHLHADIAAVEPLDPARLIPRYRHSAKRLILLDFEGTVWKRDVSRGAEFAPGQEVIEMLMQLSADKRNDVWILSGLPVKGAMEVLVDKLPKVGIVAENGCFIKPRSHKKTGPSAWINMVQNFNLTWKTACLEILNYFSERTPGSYVEEREASVVWRFWTGAADDVGGRQWARRQAAEAQNHIFDSLGERYGLRIIPGQTSFLVLPNNISRSTAVSAIMHPGGPTHSPLSGRAAWMTADASEGGDTNRDVDFVFAVSGDEKLLRRLNDLDEAETCSTSGQGTDARWKLCQEEVVKVLLQFANTA